MRTTFKIAGMELNLLFFSPIAWVLMIILTIQFSLDCFEGFENFSSLRIRDTIFPNMSSVLFSSQTGLLNSIQQSLYLYVPLITMGLFSRETSTGSIKLLLSSPVRAREIVLGKYLSMVFYDAVLIAIIGIICIITGYFSIAHMDVNLVFFSLLGLFLLLLFYSAIGLYISSLTSYQIVAAIGTLAVLAGLNYIGTLLQDLDFLRDLTYFASVQGRTIRIIRGLLVSKDVIYFLIIISVFLIFTVLKLYYSRVSRLWYLKTGTYVLVIILAILVGFLTSRPSLLAYYDATATKIYTLSPESRLVLNKLKMPLVVNTYVNLFSNFYYIGSKSNRNDDTEFWSRYRRFIPNLELNYIQYYDKPSRDSYLDEKDLFGLSAQKLAERSAEIKEIDLNDFKSPEQIKKIVDLKDEDYQSVRQLCYNGNSTFLRLYSNSSDPNPSEAQVIAAIKRLLIKPPKLAFLKGHGERSIYSGSDRDYQIIIEKKGIRQAMVNNGFDVTELSIADTTHLSKDLTALIIADPKVRFSAFEFKKICDYIDSGGNLMIACEPGSQAILNPLLNKVGLRLTDGILAQDSKNDFNPDFIFTNFTKNDTQFNKLKQSIVNIGFSGAAALKILSNNDFTVKPILVTDGNFTRIRNGKFIFDTASGAHSYDTTSKNAAYTVAVSLTRNVAGKHQRIMVLGDADFMSNNEVLHTNALLGNLSFIKDLFSWYSNNEFPIYAQQKAGLDDKVTISEAGLHVFKIFFLYVLPCLMGVIYTSMILFRKRR